MTFAVRGLFTTALFATAIFALASPAAAKSCKPPGPQIGHSQIQTSKHGTASITEYGSGGSYRKTLCDRQGQLLRSVQSAPFPFAHGRVKYLPLAISTKTRGLDDAYTTKFIEYRSPLIRGWNRALGKHGSSAHGKILLPPDRSKLKTPTAAALRGSLVKLKTSAIRKSSVSDPGNACTDPTYGLYVPEVFIGRSVSYYTALDSFPAGAITSKSIRNGASAWNNTITSCGFSDQSNVVGSRMGDTTERVHAVEDGINVVDFGDPAEVGCGGMATLACSFVFFDHGVRTGFDMRFNNGQRWVNGAKVGGFDVQSVATHEMGHALVGLNDISGIEHSNLTMYASGTPDDIRGRDLALGDVLGMRAQYPQDVDLSVRK
jgi:hypothetical protein